jgi:PAS domain S-box-containing protein
VGPSPDGPPSGSELEEFFDLSADLLCIVGFDGTFQRVNAALVATLGFPEDELLARTALEITHPDDVGRATAALATLATGLDLVRFEARVVRADGEVRWLEWNTRSVPARGVVYGAGRDTTEARGLAAEQDALRRVALMVAQGAPADALFATIVAEVGELLDVAAVSLGRNHDNKTMSPLAMWSAEGEHPPAPDRMPILPGSLAWEIVRTGRPARQDDWSDVESPTATLVRDQLGARSSVGAPIVFGGALWGAIAVHATAKVLPPTTEARLERFAALVVTALANAQSRAEVARLVDEQAALRRVATLVAHGARPSAVFDAVTAEVAELLKVSAVSLARYDGDELTVLAQRGQPHVRVGDRFPIGGANATSIVLRTGRPARVDDAGQWSGHIGDVARRVGARSIVAAPLVVDGRTWGMLAATWTDGEPPPADTEERMARFAELLDTAIANADSHDQLTASRARVLAAGDEARRRVVRDLHDGAQQRLVHTIVTLKLARRSLREGGEDVDALLAEALGNAERATDELRELAHGILPTTLTRDGLRAAVEAIVPRVGVRVDLDLDLDDDRLPSDLEATAYFIVAEALTNVAKHARATRATVRAAADDGELALEVRDDGIGGADPSGHGLLGVADRVDALGGRLRIASPEGDGTVLVAWLPLPARDGG